MSGKTQKTFLMIWINFLRRVYFDFQEIRWIKDFNGMGPQVNVFRAWVAAS
jgi:hypothetical protein